MWYWFWAAWLATGFILELAALYREAPEDTLSEFIRAFVVHSPYGSMLVGAFLVWLLWHWLYVKSGLDQSDIVMTLIGAVAGLGGWYYRNRSSEEEPEDSNPTEGCSSVEG